MNKLIVTLMTLLLAACGGGSGGSDGSSNTAQASVTNTTQTQSGNQAQQDNAAEQQATSTEEQVSEEQPAEDAPAGEGMEAVVVDGGFDFQTDVPVTVSVAPDVVNGRAYINVCQQDSVLTNEDTCFLRAPVDSTGLTVQIELPHSEQKLKAEIWYYSTDVEPLVYSWEFDGTQQQQAWLIN
ncbi:hypothetical protein [Pseudoalteromonas rubra]|uniref:Lipoprotein n=1 Tax=Pseudoalteromonas rubra TaxID=43658 RepID=A0A0U3HJS4_9GAMM|nr:hypothetical protein [Pseudoalteromonas rubra]ALU41449.1 hypothetical protein AT705_00025 [Pseudoalteromonas rubra]